MFNPQQEIKTKRDDLIPCPKCGSTDIYQIRMPAYGFSFIICDHCGQSNPTETSHTNPVDAWNSQKEAG